MKTIALLVVLMALVIGATAQANLNFADLPDAKVPTPMPNGYGNLTWSGINYVDPFQWVGAGAGFKHHEDITGSDVVFGGGPCFSSACFGAISDPLGFQLVSATLAAGYGPTSVTFTAYYKGKYVGAMTYQLTTQPQAITFPEAWDDVTQVIVQTSSGGTFVLYNLSLYTYGG